MKDYFFVDPVKFYTRHNLSPELRQEIGGMALVSGSIEFWAERLVWALRHEDPKGKYPSTDRKVISAIIGMIETLGADLSNLEPVPGATWPEATEQPVFAPDQFLLFKGAIATWCAAAKEAFECRNTMLHGVMTPWNDGSVSFLNNTRWQEVIRKREATSFYGSPHTVQLLHRVFLDLLSAVVELTNIAERRLEPNEVLGEKRLQSLSHARSVASELNHLEEAVNNEKY